MSLKSAGSVLLAFAVCSGPAWASGDLALRRVMLSTGGVAYVEYEAEVNGAATLGLDVRLDQVDDVLKSLVVFDDAGGVGGIELPGRDGSGAAFGDLPFGASALGSPLDFLNALRGVELTVTGPQPMTGRLLRAEKVAVQSGANDENRVERTRVSLLAADGLRQFVLEDAISVDVADPVLRARIGKALETLRRDAGSDTRHITLRSTAGASGSRMVRVGYVAGAPLWKTTYRLVLPDKGSDKARLQGWAVLENTTGADWNGVSLTLQYGNPVTFRQALYSTYFVTRPEVPVEIMGRLLPNVDTRARAESDAEPAPPPPAPAAMRAAPQGGAAAFAKVAASPTPMMAAPGQEPAASEGAEDTAFVLPEKVVLASGHTASVPILDRDVTASRVGLLGFGQTHPLSAIRVTNDTATSLPAGVLTLYDPASPAAFSGDARLGGLPAGESRLLSFAEDLRTTAVWRNDNASAIASVTAADGVLVINGRLRWTSRVTLSAPAGEKRDLLLELPKRSGNVLATDNAIKPIEETAAVWRFAVPLAAAETRTIALASEQITAEQISLVRDDTVLASVLSRPGLGDAAMAALKRLADLRARRAAGDAEVKKLTDQQAQLERDEDRIRRNLAAVPAGDALHTRLVRQLDVAETSIEALRASIANAQKAADQMQRDFAAAVGSFKL